MPSPPGGIAIGARQAIPLPDGGELSLGELTDLIVETTGMRQREARKLAAKVRDGESVEPLVFDATQWLKERGRGDLIVARPEPVAHNIKNDWPTTTGP